MSDERGVGTGGESLSTATGTPRSAGRTGRSADAEIRGAAAPAGRDRIAAENGATPAWVAMRRSGRALTADLGGDWELGGPTPRFEGLAGEARGDEPADSIGFDTAEVGTWDSSLVSFLLQGMNYCEANGLDFEQDGLPREIAALLALARAVPEQDIGSREEAPSRAAGLGMKAVGVYDGLLTSVTFTGEVTQGFVRLLTLRARMRWRDFWVVVQSNGSGALPIVTLISFLVGLIIAFLGAVVLRRFGAGYYVSYLVGYGMLREMAALMTGIIMAGRTGAAFAAELGSMKINEEIDAYETLGISPVDQLVLPRVLGLFVMMPLLTIYAMFVGIAGGLVVAVTLLDLTVVQFMGGLLTPVTLSDGLLGVFKGTVFGLLIGVTGCMRGLQTGKDAGAVGKAATSAVVTGITLIIVANAIIDWVAALLGV
jgi:phospholipid/cholesterol/gamma-HCH transport system permease protein